ncbi:MAG: hypothetical protein FD163_1489 [Hyphomonadaceae bacterium]|nr:MAG: hypothetical protein FD128_1235 [Hyphomonadaceae bacterium]KAF0184792.1 MAG: hypothetical protein FD163_1489 [Hyphomonadaceae bacterium]
MVCNLNQALQVVEKPLISRSLQKLSLKHNRKIKLNQCYKTIVTFNYLLTIRIHNILVVLHYYCFWISGKVMNTASLYAIRSSK